MAPSHVRRRIASEIHRAKGIRWTDSESISLKRILKRTEKLETDGETTIRESKQQVEERLSPGHGNATMDRSEDSLKGPRARNDAELENNR